MIVSRWSGNIIEVINWERKKAYNVRRGSMIKSSSSSLRMSVGLGIGME